MKILKEFAGKASLIIVVLVFASIYMHAQPVIRTGEFKTNPRVIDLGNITKQVKLQKEPKSGILIKSQKFLIYVNRKNKDLVIVSRVISITKGENFCI